MTKELAHPPVNVLFAIARSQHSLSTSVRVVHPAELDAETRSLRMSAISAMQGALSSMWAGIFVVEPSAKTAIHHHGEQETIVYVLEGEALLRWGHRREYSATAVGESVDDVHRGESGEDPTVLLITYAGTPGIPTSVPAKGEKAEY